MKRNILVLLASIIGCYYLMTMNIGCAQIGSTTGGPRDSLPPRLVRSNPIQGSVNFKGNKVSLTFNEYIDLQELQDNLIISPVQKTNPLISFNLKSISVKFKDTLLPNTTYNINFGNAIRDVHENNVLKNYSFVFSTGKTIDSLVMNGKVLLAESGLADSTIMVMLYRNLNDTAVIKTKPDYITKVDAQGNFIFHNLPESIFKIYALRDGDGGKTYNSKTETFAFNDTTVNSLDSITPILLYAYAESKPDNIKVRVLKAPLEKKLKYTINLSGFTQDLLQNFELGFNNPLKKFDTKQIILSDTNYKPIANYQVSLDSTHKKATIKTSWVAETDYRLIIPKESAEDSAGTSLSRADTLRFKTKRISDYGTVLLRFSNLDLSKHPVLQFLDGETVRFSYPITTKEWNNKLFPPGDYTIRILYDSNNNGSWTPGSFTKRIQPEKAIQLPQKLAIKADWDNERDIKL